jgi:hypothetical protein
MLYSSLWYCLQTLPCARLYRQSSNSKVRFTSSIVASRPHSSLHRELADKVLVAKENAEQARTLEQTDDYDDNDDDSSND